MAQQQDDPVAEYLRAKAQADSQQAPQDDPVADYLQAAAAARRTLSPEQQRVHKRRKGFGREPGFASEAADVVKNLGGFVGETAAGLAEGALKARDPVSMFRDPLHNIRMARDIVTMPVHAVKDWDELTTRLAEGEDVSRGEIARGAASSTLGLLGPLEAGARGISGLRPKRGVPPPTRPTQPVSPSPTPAEVQRLGDIARSRAQPRVPSGEGRSDVRARPPVPEELTLTEEFARPPARLPRGPRLEGDVQSAPRELNPLAQLDDAIAKDRLDVEALEQELAARRAPDKLRELTDEQLAELDPVRGTQPSFEESAASPLSRSETAGPEAVRSIIERDKQIERRVRQEEMEGRQERRADEPARRVQKLLEEEPSESVPYGAPERPASTTAGSTPEQRASMRTQEVAKQRALLDEANRELQTASQSERGRWNAQRISAENRLQDLGAPSESAALERIRRALDPISGPLDALARMEEKPPTEPADLTPLERRIAAERAAKERLEQQVEAIPARPRGRKHVTRAQQRAEVDKSRQRIRTLKAAIKRAEQTLREFPVKDTRPISTLRRAEALQQLRESEIELKSLQAPKPPEGGLGEEGFFGLKSRAQPPAPRTPAEAHLDAQIGSGVTADPVALRTKFVELVQNFTESAHAARTAERLVKQAGRKLPLTQRAGLWMKAALDSPKRIAGALFGEGPGYFDNLGKWHYLDSPSLDAIWKPIKGNAAEVQAVKRLMIAQRAPEYAAQGFKSGVDAAHAAEIVRRATPRQLKIAAELRGWLNSTLEGAVRSGALSRDLLNVWQKRYPHYVDYHVVFPGEGAVSRLGGGTLSGRLPAHAVRKGSELPKIDPAESIPDQGARWIRYTDLHRAMRSTLDLFDANRDVLGDLVTKLDSKPVAPSTALNTLGELLTDRALRLEGDQARIYNSATNVIETWKLDPVIADGLRALGAKEWNFALELLAAGKKGVQYGVTSGPIWGTIFGLVNFTRDNLGRPTVSGATRYPFQYALDTLVREFMGKETPMQKAFKSMGGGFGVAQESAGALGHLRRSIPGRSKLRATQRERQRTAERLTGTSPTHVKVINSINEFLQGGSVPFEEASRGAEFKAQKSLGLSDLEAYINAQEVLGNFAERPTSGWVRAFMHATPFLNPRVQGTRAFVEAFGKGRRGKAAASWALTVGLPVLALYAINMDDEEIQELRTGPGGYNSFYLRPSNFHPSLPDDIMRLPNPFGPGALGHVMEHGLDLVRGRDEHGLRRALNDVGNEFFETSINPLLGVPIALARNRALGTDVPIVPEAQTDRVPEEQVGTRPNFSLQRLSQALPEGARFSPAKAHHALGQLFGTTGRELPNLVDMATQSDRLPARRGWSDNPITSRFFARYPTTAVGSVRDVYSESRHPMAALNTLRDLAARGDAEGVLRTLTEHGDELALGGMGEQFTQTLSQITNLARQLEFAPYLEPAERTAQRDEMLRLVIELARDFHPLMHER